MSQVESAVAGFILGLMSGALIILVILAAIALRVSERDIPTTVSDIGQKVKENFYNPNQEVFLAAFVFGFLIGIGGSSELV